MVRFWFCFHQKVSLVIVYESYIDYADRWKNMAARGRGHFLIWLKILKTAFSLKPFVQLWPNFACFVLLIEATNDMQIKWVGQSILVTMATKTETLKKNLKYQWKVQIWICFH